MGVTVSSVKKLVDGSRRINQATLAFTTSVTDGDSLAPEKVGLHSIEGVKVIGMPSGTTQAINVYYIPASSKIQLMVNDTTAAATATCTCEFVGW